MYNQLIKLANNTENNSWAQFVSEKFSDEQLNTFKFILESFPENLLIVDGQPNNEVISILSMISYDVGNSRELIKNLKYSKDINYLYNSILGNDTLNTVQPSSPEVGDRYYDITEEKYYEYDGSSWEEIDLVLGYTWYDSENEILYKYSGYDWDYGVDCPSYRPTNPSDGDFWYDSNEKLVYEYTSGSWDSGSKVSLSKIREPNYRDRWLDISDSKLYSYTRKFWKPVRLFNNNIKLLISTLESMNFYLLEDEDTIEEKEEVIKNYELLARDSYMFLKNRGTLATLKRIITDFLVNATDTYINIKEIDDSSAGDIDVYLDQLDTTKVSYILDNEAAPVEDPASSGKYTYPLNKSNELYKYIMKMKPAGINVNMFSKGNNILEGFIVNSPTVELQEVDYQNNTYTLSIRNNNPITVNLYVRDYGVTDILGGAPIGSIPDFSSIPLRTVGPNQTVVETIEANYEDFNSYTSEEDFFTKIYIYLSYLEFYSETVSILN